MVTSARVATSSACYPVLVRKVKTNGRKGNIHQASSHTFDLFVAHCAPDGASYLHSKWPTGSNNDCSAIRTSTIYYKSTGFVSSEYY